MRFKSTDSNFSNIRSRVRVIVDNDFGGDPDGLFQMAHQFVDDWRPGKPAPTGNDSKAPSKLKVCIRGRAFGWRA